MAKTVYSEETIELQTGEEVVLRPLPIKYLREFNATLEDLKAEWNKDESSEETAMNLLVDLSAICLKKQLPELTADRDRFEESIDLSTIYRILEVCGGLKLNDPNQQAAAVAALSTRE